MLPIYEWTDTVVQIPRAWTAFTLDGALCERWRDGRLVAWLGDRWRVIQPVQEDDRQFIDDRAQLG